MSKEHINIDLTNISIETCTICLFLLGRTFWYKQFTLSQLIISVVRHLFLAYLY